MADPRRVPTHLIVLAGLSASAYAIALAGVTAVQSATDADLTADRAPAARAADLMSTGHEGIESTLDDASRAYSRAAAQYGQLVPQLEAMELQLDKLAKSTGAVSGAANALPSRVSLPTVSSSTRTVTQTRVVHTTTGASGKP